MFIAHLSLFCRVFIWIFEGKKLLGFVLDVSMPQSTVLWELDDFT